MKKRVSVFMPVVLAVIVTVSLLTGCGDKGASSTDGAPEEIVIGNPTSLTGNFASAGICSTFGAEAAVRDINEQGGIYLSKYDKKVPVRLITVDDQSDENKSAQLAEDLILRSNVKFLISPAGFPQCVATKALVCEKYKVPHTTGVVPRETTLALRDASDRPWEYSFMNCFSIGTPIEDPTDYRYGKGGYTIIDTWSYMLEQYGDETNKTVGFFASDDPDGAGWYVGFPAGISAAQPDFTLVGLDKNIGLFPVGTVDHSANIKAWMDAGVEILWGNTAGSDFGVLARQMRSMGFQPKMVGAARAALYYGDVSAWGGNIARGVGIEAWGFENLEDFEAYGDTTPTSLTEEWIAAKNRPFEQMLPHGYRCVQELAEAIEAAGTIEPEAVREAMKDLDICALPICVSYDDNNFNNVPIAYGQWFETDDEFGWELKIVASKHDFIPVEADPIFPY
jgi:ABC-type branched-subunit amino acid transport system substrate-binding protein